MIDKKDIAIIGVSCKFHKTKDLNDLWESLKNGKELLKFYDPNIPEEYNLIKDYIQNPNYVPVESKLDGSDSFDHHFFGYSKEEAKTMDPQIRVFHEQVWIALEDAGINPLDHDYHIGLYAAASDNLIWRTNVALLNNQMVNPFYRGQLANKNFIASLISYNLNLTGPSYYVDTACSSSLVAVHKACRNLMLRECDIAIAGGVSINSSNQIGYEYRNGMIYSNDGHCKTFDYNSSGTVKGNGVGVVILKRLKDAIKDKDNIYAVIKSSAVNNDGNKKVNYTSPSVIGQSNCISKALRIGNIDIDSIDYIEAHGTGTKLGDSIEIEALNKAYHGRKKKCPIGSIKSNLGHLDAAAGIAGLIKSILIIKNRSVPPSSYFTRPNPEINFSDGPFFINTNTQDLSKKKSSPIRIGLSSFGIGGTNAHLILEEPYSYKKKVNYEEKQRPFKILLYSALSKKSLSNYHERLITFLENTEEEFRDVCATLQTGRKTFGMRSFVISKNKEIAINCLKSNPTSFFFDFNPNKVSLILSGNGKNHLIICKELYRFEPSFKMEIAALLKIIHTEIDVDLANSLSILLLGDLNHSWKINNLMSQYIYFIIEYALTKTILGWINSSHSIVACGLGEYVAICLNGFLSFSDMFKLIKSNYYLNSKNEINFNKEDFESHLQNLSYLNEKGQYFSCNSKKIVTVDDLRSYAYWKNVLNNKIDFSTMEKLFDKNKETVFLEVGYRNDDIEYLFWENDVRMIRFPSEDMIENQILMYYLGNMWLRGIDISWSNYYANEYFAKVSAPKYCFDIIKFPLKVDLLEVIKNHKNITGTNLKEQKKTKINSVELSEVPVNSPSTLYSNTEKQLIHIWKSLLEVNEVGIEDDFFELGGDSLNTVTLIQKIFKSFNIKIDLDLFYENSTIKYIASEIDTAKRIKSMKEKENENGELNNLKL